MADLHVSALGGLRIRRGGVEITDLPSQPVRSALFVYLALERSATRDELTALLWQDSDADRARHALSQTLYELRRQLGPGCIEAQGERLQISSEVAVDAVEFQQAVQSGHDEEALSLYGGSLLKGWQPPVTPEFETWLDRRRGHLERLHRDLCRRLTETRLQAGDRDGALRVARRWVEADPYDDEGQHRLIELLAASGRRADALRQYAAYEELIARELEVEPLDETKALVASIRDRADGIIEQQPRPSHPPPSAAPPPAATPSAAAPSAAAPSAERPADAPAHRDPAIEPELLTQGWWRRLVVFAGLALLLLAAAMWLRSDRPAPSGESVATIAVLPFLNLSADPEQEYFSDGITEDILTSLSRIEGLRVISRTSVWRYKQQNAPMAQIARDLGVDYVLEGSVRREGEDLRVIAQLIEAASDTHLWAETYDRELPGVFQIQSEIAQRVAHELRHRLAPDDRARIAAGGTDNLAAYDLLLRGREYLNRPGDADVRKFAPAMSFFRRAVEADPSFAPAYVGIAETFRRNVHLLPEAAADSAVVYAERAAQLDPDLAEAAAALGAAYSLAGQLGRAAEQFRRALELDRNHAEAMSGLARLAALDGRLDEAVRWERRAVSVDPSSAARLAGLGSYLFDLGDLAGAETAFEAAVDFAPDFPEPAFLLAQIHLIRGEEQLADQRMEALMVSASDHPATQLLMARYQTQRGRFAAAAAHLEQSPRLGAVIAVRAHHLKRSGETERAAELLEWLRERVRVLDETGVDLPPRPRLYIHALSGDRDAALATLAEHWRTGLRGSSGDPPEIGVYWIDQEPFMEELRDDPRFQDLLRAMRGELDSMRARLDG